jgi:ribonuclease HI
MFPTAHRNAQVGISKTSEAIVRFGMDETRDVTFGWIKGHGGDRNNRVDGLARAAALSAG